MPTILKVPCGICGKLFSKTLKRVNEANKWGWPYLCSYECKIAQWTITTTEIECGQCKKQVRKRAAEHAKSKSGLSFCSRSCAAVYNNAHKTTGTRRSKLECWLEERLQRLYPNLDFIFNGKEAINSELDIYIPSLNLAFELNGIFHYESIYGNDKLKSIQNNDNRKFQACLENDIELCIIDASQHVRINDKTNQKYLDIIAEIINLKL